MDFLISFEDLKAGNAALKKLRQAFTRAGAPVAAIDVDPKTRRTSGLNYRQAQITFTDSQIVMLGIKTTGDIFEVRVNGAALPIKAQDDQIKAVGEIARALDAGRVKFQAKLARQKVALPKGITTAAPKMEVVLQEAQARLDANIEEAQGRIQVLRAELGEDTLDSASVLADPSVAAAIQGRKVLRGVAHRNATWKEGDTSKGDVVYVWDAELPAPYVPGQFPRIGNEGWAASTSLFTFQPAIADEVNALIAGGVVLDGIEIPDAKDLSGAEIDTLKGLILSGGKLEDGDVASKSGRDALVARGLVAREDGDNILTALGKGAAATLDDVSGGVADTGRSWLGFKIMDRAAALQAAAMALPSAHELAGPVALELTDDAGGPMRVYGTVVETKFRAGKVLYSVAVPIVPQPKVGVQLMAVLHDIESQMVAPVIVTEDNPAPILDAVGFADDLKRSTAADRDAADAGLNSLDDQKVLASLVLARSIIGGATLDDAGVGAAISQLKESLYVVETNYPFSLARGDLGQAELQASCAKSYHRAIAILENDTATLDSVDIPINSFDDVFVAAANRIAARLAAGEVLDKADFSNALATLQIALDTVETNYPINLAEGNLDQAELEERAAESFRAAITMLEAEQAKAA